MNPNSNSELVETDKIVSDSELRSSFSEDTDGQKSVLKQKEDELKVMQNQIETYNHMAKQLANQREMAVKKLAEMNSQIVELKGQLERERTAVDSKEQELKNKRTQLQTLKNEEDMLKEKFSQHKEELSLTNERLSNTQLTEAQVKTKLIELNEYIAITNAAMGDIEKAIEHKDTIKLSYLCAQALTPPPLSVNNILTNSNKSSTSPSSFVVQPRTTTTHLPNNQNNENDSIFDSSTNFDPFANDDPFVGDDPFKSEDGNFDLPEDDPFNPAAASDVGLGTAFRHDDPFAP